MTAAECQGQDQQKPLAVFAGVLVVDAAVVEDDDGEEDGVALSQPRLAPLVGELEDGDVPDRVLDKCQLVEVAVEVGRVGARTARGQDHLGTDYLLGESDLAQVEIGQFAGPQDDQSTENDDGDCRHPGSETSGTGYASLVGADQRLEVTVPIRHRRDGMSNLNRRSGSPPWVRRSPVGLALLGLSANWWLVG